MQNRRSSAWPSLMLALAVSVSAVPAAGSGGRSWSVALESAGAAAEGEAPSSLVLRTVRYDVDVLGSVAVGKLIHEFRSDAPEVLRAEPRVSAPSSLRSTETTVKIDGERVLSEERDDETAREAAGAVSKRTAPARSSRAGGRSRGQRPEAPRASRPADLRIEPGQVVRIETRFHESLRIVDGRFHLTLPAVEGSPSSAGAQETLVPVDLALRVHHDQPLWTAESPSHEIFVDFEGDRSHVELAEVDGLGETPFELEYTLGAEEEVTLAGFSGVEEEDGRRELLVVLAPPSSPGDASIRPKELLFVVDSSGSMAKGKLDRARDALRDCLDSLRERDRFNVIEFDEDVEMLSAEPLDASEAAAESTQGWLARVRAGGGTRLLPALGAAFEQPEDPTRHRLIVVLTDGNVADERQAGMLIERELGEGRLFMVGIGEDVRRPTVQRLAELGRGSVAFAEDPESLDAVISELFTSVADPLIWDLEIDWAGAEVDNVRPRRLPDLYAGRPVTIFAEVRGDSPAELTVRGSSTEGPRTFRATPIAVEGVRLHDSP